METLNAIATSLGLNAGSPEREEFFDAARRPNTLPADVQHMAGRRLIPALLRTIDNAQLDDAALTKLIDEMEWRVEETADAQ